MSRPRKDLQECHQTGTGVETSANNRAGADATPTLRNPWGIAGDSGDSICFRAKFLVCHAVSCDILISKTAELHKRRTSGHLTSVFELASPCFTRCPCKAHMEVPAAVASWRRAYMEAQAAVASWRAPHQALLLDRTAAVQ